MADKEIKVHRRVIRMVFPRIQRAKNDRSVRRALPVYDNALNSFCQPSLECDHNNYIARMVHCTFVRLLDISAKLFSTLYLISLLLLSCWCFTALRHYSGHFGRGQLTYPHCSWASLLGSLLVLSAHSFASN